MRLVWLALAGTCSGCLSLASFRSARAVEPRTLDFGLDLNVAHVQGTSALTPELQLRYGVARGLDFGLKLGFWSAGLNSTIQLHRGRLLELALGPALSWSLGSGLPTLSASGAGGSDDGEGESWELLALKLPLLIGINVTPNLQLVAGPTLIGLQGFDVSGPLMPQAVLAGGTLGLWLHLSGGFELMPEVGVFAPVIGRAMPTESEGLVSVAPGGPLYVQAGLAVGFAGLDL